MKVIRRFMIFVFLVCIITISVLSYWGYQQTLYKNPKEVTLVFRKGSSVRFMANALEKKGVIANAWVFEILLRVRGIAAKLKAGEYEFEKDLTLDEVITKLVEGKVKLYQFTIPEGQNIREVCKILVQEKKLMTASECETLSRDVSFLSDKSGALSLEGYLFPETYTYDQETTPKEIFKHMVEMFYEKTKPLADELSAKNLKLHDVVILASVVEKETGVATERPIIAGVFWNRLKIDMPLQSDPTTIYGIENFDGNLTRKHLETDHPYNTYTRRGLPIGPIANPGFLALDAVVHPKPTEALYFVAKGNGAHYFSKTLDEHNTAVRFFQLKTGSPPEGTTQP